jgi:hypothetical protein
MSGLAGRTWTTFNKALPSQVERHDPLNSLYVVCEAHQLRNEEIVKRAREMLRLGCDLNQTVEYCRQAYRLANEKYRIADDCLNGLRPYTDMKKAAA